MKPGRNRLSKGASLTEYGLLVGLIAVLAVASVMLAGRSISSIFSGASGTLETNGLAEAPGADEIAPFIKGVGDTKIVTGVTQVTPTIFEGTADGDLMVAYISHRSSLTLPSGWQTVLMEQTAGFGQFLTVATKTYTPGDGGSATFLQDVPDRMLAHVQTISGDDPKIASYDSTSGSANYTGAAYQHLTPGFTYAGDDALILAAYTDAYAATSGDTTITGPSGWTQSTPVIIADNRLAASWLDAPVGSAGTTNYGVGFVDGQSQHAFASAIIQVTNGGVVKGPAAEGYDPAPVQADEWMALKERVHPSDPASIYIPEEPLATLSSDGYQFQPEEYPRMLANLHTNEDGSGFIDANIARGSYYLANYPSGEAEALNNTVVGKAIWVKFADDSSRWYAFEITAVNSAYQINIGRQMQYAVNADFLGVTYNNDPSDLRYDDGQWWLAP